MVFYFLFCIVQNCLVHRSLTFESEECENKPRMSIQYSCSVLKHIFQLSCWDNTIREEGFGDLARLLFLNLVWVDCSAFLS